MLGIRVLTWLKGERVGQDAFGNVYYRMKGQKPPHDRRWVIYKGRPEASKVPAQWHGWLHHMTDEVPVTSCEMYSWQKDHMPNLTGTVLAYRPPGHILQGGKRDKAIGDYVPWSPQRKEA